MVRSLIQYVLDILISKLRQYRIESSGISPDGTGVCIKDVQTNPKFRRGSISGLYETDIK
jgi:hypothetical protein